MSCFAASRHGLVGTGLDAPICFGTLVRGSLVCRVVGAARVARGQRLQERRLSRAIIPIPMYFQSNRLDNRCSLLMTLFCVLASLVRTLSSSIAYACLFANQIIKALFLWSPLARILRVLINLQDSK